jgi:PEP-CTERM motif-containing protein
MKKLLVAILGALGMTGSANAATILSEDFESGFGVFTPSGNVFVATGADYQACCGTTGNTTNHFVAFGAGNDPSGTIMSTTFDTVLGQLYTVTFDYGALGSGSEALTLMVDGVSIFVVPVADNNLDTTFDTFSFGFTSSGPTTVSFFSSGVDDVDAIIDNISVTTTAPAVPEPGTWVLMLLGFGAVGYTMRRAHRATAVAELA